MYRNIYCIYLFDSYSLSKYFICPWYFRRFKCYCYL